MTQCGSRAVVGLDTYEFLLFMSGWLLYLFILVVGRAIANLIQALNGPFLNEKPSWNLNFFFPFVFPTSPWPGRSIRFPRIKLRIAPTPELLLVQSPVSLSPRSLGPRNPEAMWLSLHWLLPLPILFLCGLMPSFWAGPQAGLVLALPPPPVIEMKKALSLVR